jgi:hypothetical protein
MQASTSAPVLKRLVTGYRCETDGCFEMALWLVSLGGKNFHWCAKHTKIGMRDQGRWGAQAPGTRELGGPGTKPVRPS